MELNEKALANRAAWQQAGIELPEFDRAGIAARTAKNPGWLHFGPGNIFRAFIASLQQSLLNEGLCDFGIIAAAPNDRDIIDKVYAPHDNLSLLVTMLPDQSIRQKVIGSVTEGLAAVPGTADWRRLQEIAAADSLQLVSFTITEKGYKTRDKDGAWLPAVAADAAAGWVKPQSFPGKLTSLLYTRFLAGARPVTLMSLDNCSKNGLVLRSMVLDVADAWQEKGFVNAGFADYVREKLAYPCSMIDKITPRPADHVQQALREEGLTDMALVKSARGGWYAPFVNAEKTEYLVVEDVFANGRPPLEKAGVIFTDAQTVDRVEHMKVCTCLNPLHTALAIFGCLLGYTSIAGEMQDVQLKKLVERIGYDEGMKVVTDPGVLEPKAFIDECIQVRFPNPAIPDTPQRIACDTSQKLGVRFGETIKAYSQNAGLDAKSLIYIPLAIAGWCRYLMGLDDAGKTFELSPDPLLAEVQPCVAGIELGRPDTAAGRLRPILSNAKIFGSDLYAVGLGEKIENYFAELIAGPGAVRAVLTKYLD